MVEKYHQFYTDYKDKLFNYLRYKSGNSEVAQDIMQESFARHFKYYGLQDVISPSLLFTIARNALVDFQRHQVKFRNTEFTVQATTPDEESVFIAKEEHSQVHEAIATLSEQNREILILAVGGMSYKEIAAIYNISIANVKVIIHRSRTKLRNILNNRVQ